MTENPFAKSKFRIPRPSKNVLIGVGVGAALFIGLLVLGRGSPKWLKPVLSSSEDIPLQEFPAQLASVYCSALSQCNPQVELDARWSYGGFERNCKNQWEAMVREDTLSGMAQAIENGTVEYDPAAARQCLAKLGELACMMFDVSLFDVCTDTFEGKAEDTCQYAYECTAGQRCELLNECPGKCVSKSLSGQPCRGPGDCHNGLYCSELSATCEPLGDKGDACKEDAGDYQCMEGLFCVEEKCTPLGKLYSEPADKECDATKRCAKGLSCAQTKEASVCKPLATSGGACFEAFPSMCPEGEFCDADLLAGRWSGKCEPVLEAGAKCDAPEQCASGLACAGGVCTKLGTQDSACVRDSECWSGHCVGKKCAPRDPCPEKKEG